MYDYNMNEEKKGPLILPPPYKTIIGVEVLVCSWVDEEELASRRKEIHDRLMQAAMDIHMDVCKYDG